MESRFVASLQRLNGWRLWLLFSLATVLAALLIVSLMDLALLGRISADYLLTGLVAAGIVAPASLFLMRAMLQEIARQQQLNLSRSVESAEARLRVALDSSDEGVLMVAADGRVLSANRRFFELWRVPPEVAATERDDRLLKHVRDQLIDPNGFMAGVQRLYASEAQARDTLRFKDGRVFERYTQALAIGTEHGRIWCFRDVSDQARTREALAEREEQYRAIVNQAGDGIDLVDAETLNFLEVNEAGCRMLGYRRDELLALNLATVQASMDEPALRAAVARVVREGEASFECRHHCSDGRLIDVFVRTRAIQLHGRTCLVNVWHDITARKEAEWNLRMAVEVTQVAFWKLDYRSQALSFDETSLQILGLEPDEALTSLAGWMERLHPDDAGLFMERLLATMAPGGPVFDLEYRLCQRNGQHQWIHTKGRFIQRDPDDQPVLAVGTSMNITRRKRTEAELRRSEARFQLVADHVSDVIWLYDLAVDRFAYLSPSIMKLRGFSVEEGLSQTLAQTLTPESYDLVRDLLAKRLAAFAAGDPASLTQTHQVAQKRKDGSIVATEMVSTLIADANGQVTHIQGVTRDITERRREEAELERHRRLLEELVQQRSSELQATEARASRILDSAADGLYGADREGRITFINPAACRMLGYTPDQVLGRSAHELFHHSRQDGSPYPASECSLREVWRTGRECRVDDDTYWHADGHPVPVTLACHPIVEQDEIVGTVISVVDVSTQRAATLAREQALVAAENLARARSEFLANMSHEIRTPMNGVLGFAQIGRRYHQNAEKAGAAFDKIIAAGNQLLGVVNDILDFSKVDAGKLQIEATEVSLGAVLDHALQHVADRARVKALDLRLDKAEDLPQRCIGDPLRLGQVLLNLLTNAIKFTEAGSVTLSAAREGSQLVFRVTDTGIGMTAEQLGYVFNPFQQADGSTTRRFGGTGLGLAICKRLLELMQGEIRVDSSPGRGSQFEVRLPFVAPSNAIVPGEAAPATQPVRPLANIAILLVEDDDLSQKMLELMLEDEGARVVSVGDGFAAVERVFADGPEAFDLVLMDIQMPDMDGYEATRRLRELAPALPIIGQTASAFEEDRDKCLEAGMAGHIAKPIDAQALTSLVLQVLAARRAAA